MPDRSKLQRPEIADELIDWVILTAIGEEYDAAAVQLQNITSHGWWPVPVTVGTVGHSRVLCVLSGKGSKKTAAMLTFINSRTRATKVAMVGIAGGFPEQGIKLGDVVVAKFIFGYDFGKLVKGKYILRPEEDGPCDDGLVGQTMAIAENSRKKWFNSIEVPRPDGQPPDVSKVHDGFVASGDKVVDNMDNKFFRAVLQAKPEIHAVEMEAAGAMVAVRLAQTMGVMRFVMIKGISDQPRSDKANTVNNGKQQRTLWKRYAATAAATLVRHLIQEDKPFATSSPQDKMVGLRPPRRRDDDCPDIADLYHRFWKKWEPTLREIQEDSISVVDAVDWLLRSLSTAFDSQSFATLKRYSNDDQLPVHLPRKEEVYIRQLRNLGLVKHDGPYLFCPSRSSRVAPTSAGWLLVALGREDEPRNWEKIARDVARELAEIAHQPKAVKLLQKVYDTGKISDGDRETARKLRNLHLVTQLGEFLAATNRLALTGLGSYVLQKANLRPMRSDAPRRR